MPKNEKKRKERKYQTFAEGFAAAAEIEQQRLDMHERIARRLRREERVEVRDGREFKVLTLPEAKPPERRSAKTRFHFADVDKTGENR